MKFPAGRLKPHAGGVGSPIPAASFRLRRPAFRLSLNPHHRRVLAVHSTAPAFSGLCALGVFVVRPTSRCSSWFVLPSGSTSPRSGELGSLPS
jgi:hypothetical protein